MRVGLVMARTREKNIEKGGKIQPPGCTTTEDSERSDGVTKGHSVCRRPGAERMVDTAATSAAMMTMHNAWCSNRFPLRSIKATVAAVCKTSAAPVAPAPTSSMRRTEDGMQRQSVARHVKNSKASVAYMHAFESCMN